MTAHVRKGFEKWHKRLYGPGKPWTHEEIAFRAGVRFEQGRERAAYKSFAAAQLPIMHKHQETRHALATALELLSRTPAGKREADKLRGVLK